ncbi:hypothetical protein CEP54_006750 [Fusarium duplospermum]|uniref:DUF7908 domain-containing protein n=1 Tax=Fusarium duplospermum TaxID=1325734 RepID=A0A428Q5F0_9HYPO|nr:hypothetical protein CEP54_006750 [Fusarium duplospermum]
MKRHVFIAAVLGTLGRVAADDQASMALDSLCVTYLSTYLAPISIQDEPSSSKKAEWERPSSENTGRLPITPNIRPTFGRNSSTTEDRTGSQDPLGSDTSLPDFEPTRSFPSSLIDPESVDIEATSLDSTGGMITDDVTSLPALTTSDLDIRLSSDALPTSSGFLEPAGRLVLFVVSVAADNEKRDLNKRAMGGFVGNDNPDVCTFAATFNLAESQLFEGGVPIYYSGEDFKELAGQDLPPPGAITMTFSASAQGLVFRNSALPNGQAGYCQGTDGKVYITFTSGPPGCTPVDVAIYDVAQCQNGVLVGLGSSSSTGSDVPTPETSTSQVASRSSSPVSQSTDSVPEAPSDNTDSEVSTAASSKGQSSEPLDPIASTTDSSISVETSTDSTVEHESSYLQPADTSSADISTSSEKSPSLESTTRLSDESSTSSTIVEISTDSTIQLESSSLQQAESSSRDLSTSPGDSSTSSDESPLLESTALSSEESSASSVSPTSQIDTESQSDSETAASSDSTTIADAESTSDALETTLDATTQETTSSSGDGTTTQIPTTTEDTTTIVSTSEDLSTAQEATTASVDACVSGITSPDGQPPLPDREDDCKELNVVTVSPYTVTTTIVENQLVLGIPTGWPTLRPTLTQLARRQAEEATTITPSATPDYATYCDSPSDYYEACSSLGVTRFTTTLPTPTKTETSTEPECFVTRMVKRAGESLG